MPRINIESITASNLSDYPVPFNEPVKGRWARRLGQVCGIGELGASHVELEPGAWSSQRHWHEEEDELLVMLSGEAVLIEGGGRTVLRPGDVCLWPKGVPDGHHLVNESEATCTFIAVSAGNPEGRGTYSDIDMTFSGDGYFHKDGAPYPPQSRR